MAVLCAVLAAITAGVFVGWRAADRHADSVDADQPGTLVPATPAVVQPSTPALTTPLLSFRRMPGILAGRSNDVLLARSLAGLASLLSPTSCLAVSVDGRSVIAQHASTPLLPASNVKLVVAAVALDVLGPDHTFSTTVRGTIGEGGAVDGDLYLIGGGDPLLASAWWDGTDPEHPQFNETSLEALADAVVAAGVTSVGGGVVGDPSRYDLEYYPAAWTDDLRAEAGPAAGLVANDGRDVALEVGDDPARTAARELTALLRERGVTVASRGSSGTAATDVPIVATISSTPLSAIVAEMLTTSDDHVAEMLLREIGLAAFGAGNRNTGILAVIDRLNSWGVPTAGVRLIDGSGLSSEDRLTCEALLAILQRSSVDDALGAGLPIAGAPGGTLAAELVATPVAGKLRAKTGTLGNLDNPQPGVKALSGYLPTSDGTIEFSMILNGDTIADPAEYQSVWDALARALATYPASASAAALGPR
jgi:D-alanyl-D-alanine carboxypeptidase/D-alanyl-D-alanine-endopeptidase (penicillin-binding protein 4)